MFEDILEKLNAEELLFLADRFSKYTWLKNTFGEDRANQYLEEIQKEIHENYEKRYL